jgi:hypothetical protein
MFLLLGAGLVFGAVRAMMGSGQSKDQPQKKNWDDL